MNRSLYKPIPLPIGVALTERSRKFYDGTYKWDSEGFSDENGVYRQFNSHDPIARAPSPLPPMLLSEVEDESLDKEVTIIHHEQHFLPNSTSTDLAASKPSYVSAKQDEFAGCIADIPNLLDAPDVFTFASDSKDEGHFITVRRDELFCGRVDREHLIGKFQGILIACQHAGVGLSLEKCYQLCGVPPPVDKMQEAAERKTPLSESFVKDAKVVDGHAEETGHLPVTILPSENLGTMMVVIPCKKEHVSSHIKVLPSHQSSSSTSDLSDPPSDISDWGIDTQKTQQDVVTPTKTTHREKDGSSHEGDPVGKTTPKAAKKTRGVARKVVKKKNSMAAKAMRDGMSPVVLSVQTDSPTKTAVRSGEDDEGWVVGTTSQRRSSRLSRGKARR